MVAICGPSGIASGTMALCTGCEQTFEQTIARFYQQDDTAIEFFQCHGVLPKKLICKSCLKECNFDSERNRFHCNRQCTNPKNKRVKKCNYTVSIFKDTWLENAKIKPNENLRFLNIYLRPIFSQKYLEENFGWSPHTAVDWRSFASEVCASAIKNFGDLLGEGGRVVECDERILEEENLIVAERHLKAFGYLEHMSVAPKKYILQK